MTLNPQFRLVSRLSVGPKGAYAWIALLLVAMPLTTGVRGHTITAAAAASIGYVFMCCAVPYAALHVRLLDHRRQMDLIRMVGARDDVTLFYLAAGGGWWIAGTGVVLVAVARAAGESLSSLGLASSLLGLALGVVLLALPFKPSKRWSILLFIPAIGVMLGEGFVRYSEPLQFIAVGGALALAAACAPIAVRELARQTTGGRQRSGLQAGRGRLFRKTSHPEFARMFLSTASSVWLLPAIGLTVMPVVAWWSARNAVRASAPELLGAALSAPVVATALIASVRSRDEFVSGGIERMSLSGRRPIWSLAELSAGIIAGGLTLIVPAVVTATVVAPKMTLQLLGWIALVSPGLLAIALSEGLSNRKFAVYVAPVLAGFFAFSGEARATWWVVPLASWVPIAVAVASMARPGTVPLQRGTALLAIATVGACLGLLHTGWRSISWVACVMSLFAGLTTPGRSVNKWSWLALATTAGWISAAATQAALTALHLPTFTWRAALEHPWAFAALFGAFAGAGTFYGTSAHFVGHRSRTLSFALRAAPLVAALDRMPY